MYEGKNIHFSPLDNKPLCSYSAKVCKQRRLNGYSLCLRHVLEDPGAPFRQCLYQARNKQQCTNPIHKNNDAQFCTSHLQLLGLIPVGAKSCSKANRDGKLIKNGLHSSGSPCQKDQLRNKSKTCDNNVISITEMQSVVSDPYTFSDVDPPKTSKSSPPLLSMVADVSGMHSCLTAICSAGTKPTVPQEPNRSIPISRLYPELVEKLESDRNKSHPKSKAARSLRTASTPASRNSQNRIKLKKCSSPSSGVMSTADSTEPMVPASCLSTLMNQSVVLSVSPSSSTATSTGLSTPAYNSLGTRLDLSDEKMAVSMSSSEMKNATVISRSPWMLPVFEHPLVTQQTMPVMQTFSKALHGLLNPVPLLKSSVQSPLTPSAMPQSTVSHSLFRSQSEPQRPPDKGLLLHQTPTITSSTVSQRLASLDLKLASTLVSAPSLGLLQTNQGFPVVPETTSASNSQPAATMAAEMVSNFIKTLPTANSDDAQSGSGSRTIHFVRPRSKAHRFSYKEAKNRMHRKCAMKIYLDHSARVMDNSNLLPTGVDSSDDDDDLDHELPWQRLWNDLSSDEGEGDFDLSEDITSNIRRTKLQLLKSKMRRQFTQLQRCREGNTPVRTHHRTSIDDLIASCRQDTHATVDALRSIKNIKPSNSSFDRSGDVLRLHKRPCLHRNDCDVVCNSVALPYTNHCLKHIMYNVDQLLFGYCTAKFPDKTQCCVPVFDIKHELPLCCDHLTKDIIQESQEVKPKKQRKKTKPSALTRPPKKGKKKKCQRKTVQKPQKPFLTLDNCLASSVDMSVCDGMTVDPSTLSSVSSSSSLSMSVQTSRLDSSAAAVTGGCTMLSSESKDSIDDDALGSDLDVTFSPTGLPLDNDQGTNFLDEHELHEMLNKMADEAFELSAGKNGCYPSSKEVEEEFVRVLVEATKNLSESKDRLEQLSHEDHSLATLLPDGPNEDELTKQIADSLLNRSTLSPSGSVSDDQDNLNDLASSLTVHDLRSISQVMESSIISQALDLCPTGGVAVPHPLHRSNDGTPNNCINYLNGSGLLQQQYPAQEHPLGTVSGAFPPIVDQSQLGPVDTHVRFPGLVSFPLTSNGMLDSSLATSHLNPTTAPAVPPAPRFPSVLSSMLPLAALGMCSSRVVVSLSHGITSSQTMRPPAVSYSGDDSFGQVTTFHSLPDIQTLIKQPWRIPTGDSLVNPEFRPTTATFSTTSVPVNFPNSQFSYIPNFHPPQFLVSESKPSSVLPKTEPECIQTTRTALPETNAADLFCSANSALSSLHKVFNPQMPSTP